MVLKQGFDDSMSAKIRKYGLLGYCHKDSKKIRAIANTLDAIIKCGACKHFDARATVKNLHG